MNWDHPQRLGSDKATDNPAYGDFNKEDSVQINVFIRELFQNLVDAEKIPDEKKTKKVKIRILRPEDGLDVSFIEELLSSHEARLNASPLTEESRSTSRTLIIEEENFKGLRGQSITKKTHFYREKKTNHFRHFFLPKSYLQKEKPMAEQIGGKSRTTMPEYSQYSQFQVDTQLDTVIRHD